MLQIQTIIQDIKNPTILDTTIINTLNSHAGKALAHSPNNTQLLQAASAQANRTLTFKHLLTFKSIKPPKLQPTPLHLLVRYSLDANNHKSLSDLIRLTDRYINSKDERGQTPLHYSVIYSNYPAAKLLLTTPGVSLSVLI